MIPDRGYLLFSRICNAAIKETITDEDRLIINECSRQLGSEQMMLRTERAKMQPFIARAMIDSGADDETWRLVLDEYRYRNRLVIDELSNVHSALQEAGITKFFLSENFAAMLSAGGDIGLFASGDVDHCCYISENQRVSDVFRNLGYTICERYAGNLLVSTEYSNPNRLPKGFHIGFQYEPLARLKLPSLVHLDQFVDWAKCCNYDHTAIVLPPTDALMYISLLHISLHSFCRAPAIRLYRDVVNCAKQMTESDWNMILEWAKRDNTINRISLSLKLSELVAGVSIPERVKSMNNSGISRILMLTYDELNEVLTPEPSRFKIMRIEMNCDDKSTLHGLRSILFPDSMWMQQVYGKCGISSYIRHLSEIL